MSDSMLKDLFLNLPTGALTAKQRKALYATAPRRKGHFGTPGMGPAGETCGTCAYYRSVEYHNKTYPKCGQTRRFGRTEQAPTFGRRMRHARDGRASDQR
jgi:hypothetical protein